MKGALDNLIKDLGKYDFKYLIKKFDSKVIDLVEQKKFYWKVLKSLKTDFLIKTIYIVHWLVKISAMKIMNMFSMFGISSRWKRWKIITICSENVML